jgi:integrase
VTKRFGARSCTTLRRRAASTAPERVGFARYARLEVAASKLKAHRLASPYSQDEHFVFPAPDGRGRDHRSVGRGIERAVEWARLGAGISAHSSRHTDASQLIVGLGLDPVRVAKQLGHRNAGFTAATYAHMFEQARHADELRSSGSGRRRNWAKPPALNLQAGGRQFEPVTAHQRETR